MKLVAISAWNDSGGGFLNRLLDGHPALRVWPYELLLGSDKIDPDGLSPELFRGRFRWPRLHQLLAGPGEVVFDAISDSELRSVLKDGLESKHRDYLVDISLEHWRARVGEAWLGTRTPSQARFIDVYINTFFEELDGEAAPYKPVLGHCPVLSLDAERVWEDFPDAKIVHVVRHPFAGFADMRQRHPTLGAESYAMKWSLVNQHAALLAKQHASNFCIVTLQDLLKSREETLRTLCDFLQLAFHPILLSSTWRGQPLQGANMGPFGGVPDVDWETENKKCASLSAIDEQTIETLSRGARKILSQTAKIEFE